MIPDVVKGVWALPNLSQALKFSVQASKRKEIGPLNIEMAVPNKAGYVLNGGTRVLKQSDQDFKCRL